MTAPALAPAGWYGDPAHRYHFRYWDGGQWTAQVSNGGTVATDHEQPGLPVVTPVTAPPAPRTPALPVPQAPAFPQTQAFPPAPAAPPRRRRLRVLLMSAGVLLALLGLAAGLVIWAPWRPPPLLRPTGLAAGAATTSSVSLRWARPATGPLPDRWLILREGKPAGSVPGTATSYVSRGLAPATRYLFQVVAVRGGKSSHRSAGLTLSTKVPPLSAARLAGPWTVAVHITHGAGTLTGNNKNWSEVWVTRPECDNGACAAMLSGTLNGHRFHVYLTRAGRDYSGKTVANVIPCGTGPNAFPISSTLKVSLKVRAGEGINFMWTATRWSGSLTLSMPYTSSGSYYCSAVTLKARLSAY